jgi:O-antigen/teichoic acid export membrane protein
LLQVLKRLFKQSAVYAVGTVLNRAVSILMLPFYTRYLTKSEFGILEILLITSTILLFVLQLGMGPALFRSVLYKKKANRRIDISTAYYFLAFFALAVIVLLTTAATPLSLVLFDDPDKAVLLRIIFIGDFFLLLNAIPMVVLRIDQKSVKFATIASSNFFLGISLNILFLVVFRQGVRGVVTANTIAAVLFSAIYFFVIRRELQLIFSFRELKDMLLFGLPLVPGAIGDMVLMMSDRYFIKFYRGLDELACYGVAIRISLVISLMVSAFQMAWPAIFFPMVKEKDAHITLARIFTYFWGLLVTFGFILSVFSREIITLIATTRFVEGARVIPYLMIAFIFYGVYYYTSIGIQIKKKTIFFPIVIGITAVVSIGLNFLLVPRYGQVGAGLAKMFALVTLGFGICAISSRYYYIPFEYARLLKVLITAVVLYLASTLLSGSSTVIVLLQKGAIVLLFPVMLLFIGFFTDTELAFLKKK